MLDKSSRPWFGHSRWYCGGRSVWICSAYCDWLLDGTERDAVEGRTDTCRQQVSVVLIVARPACLAHCAHPPTDGTKGAVVRTARVVRNGRKGEEEGEQRSYNKLGKGPTHGSGHWGQNQ